MPCIPTRLRIAHARLHIVTEKLEQDTDQMCHVHMTPSMHHRPDSTVKCMHDFNVKDMQVQKSVQSMTHHCRSSYRSITFALVQLLLDNWCCFFVSFILSEYIELTLIAFCIKHRMCSCTCFVICKCAHVSHVFIVRIMIDMERMIGMSWKNNKKCQNQVWLRSTQRSVRTYWVISGYDAMFGSLSYWWYKEHKIEGTKVPGLHSKTYSVLNLVIIIALLTALFQSPR